MRKAFSVFLFAVMLSAGIAPQSVRAQREEPVSSAVLPRVLPQGQSPGGTDTQETHDRLPLGLNFSALRGFWWKVLACFHSSGKLIVRIFRRRYSSSRRP